MLRSTSSLAKGITSILIESLKRVPPYARYKIVEFFKTGPASDESLRASSAMQAARQKHKELYHKFLQQQYEEAQKKRNLETKGMTAYQKLKYDLKQFQEQNLSQKAGAMSLLRHCIASHAASLAMEQNLDVQNINLVTERRVKKSSSHPQSSTVEYEDVVVGYISAPKATNEEVYAFARAVGDACPAAKAMQVEWRVGSSSHTGSKEEPSINPQEVASVYGKEKIPEMVRGTPGGWRSSEPSPTSTSRTFSRSEEENFSLPGVGRRATRPKP